MAAPHRPEHWQHSSPPHRHLQLSRLHPWQSCSYQQRCWRRSPVAQLLRKPAGLLSSVAQLWRMAPQRCLEVDCHPWWSRWVPVAALDLGCFPGRAEPPHSLTERQGRSGSQAQPQVLESVGTWAAGCWSVRGRTEIRRAELVSQQRTGCHTAARRALPPLASARYCPQRWLALQP